MGIGTDINKVLTYKVETVYGVAATGAGGQMLRRVSSDLSLAKETYESNEVRNDQQMADFRHGVRRANGRISGELSPDTYADFMASVLKRDFAAVTALAGMSLTIAGAGPLYTVTRAAGDYLAGNVKVGHVVRLTGVGLNAANSGKNLLVVDATATVLTVLPVNGSALVAEGPIAASGLSWPGKTTFIPTAGHVERSFTIEHFYPEVPSSEVFVGCKIDRMSFALPPTGMATCEIEVMGKDIVTGPSQVLTTPTAVTGTGALAAVNGVLRVAGQIVATVTGLTLDIDPDFKGDPVVGSNTIPYSFPGKIKVSGQMTAYFESTTLRDAFVNETEIDLAAVFTSDNGAPADFIAFALPRIKVGGASKGEGSGGVVQTIPFQALLNSAGGTGIKTEKTTIQVQDSQA